MTAFDSASLKHFESLADWGTKLVIIGVAGEGIELLIKFFEPRLKKRLKWRHFFHKTDPWINAVGGVFWIMVVLGLCWEFSGNHKAKVILDKDNAELHLKAAKLEASRMWRLLTPQQTNAFKKATEEIRKFPVRVRYGTYHSEVEGFAKMVRGMLDSAGFVETNVAPIGPWPPGDNLLFHGGDPDELPSVMFLNNVEVTNNPVETNIVADKLYYVMSATSAVEEGELQSVIAQTNPFAFYIDSNGAVAIALQKTNYEVVVPSHSTRSIRFVSDPNIIRLWSFLQVRAAFYSIGVTAGWMTATNLAPGVCEVFINPRL